MTDSHKTAITVVDRAPLPDRMHPMVKAMMANSPDPSTLRELLAVQREYEAGEAKREFTAALIGLKHDLPLVIAHDTHVKFLNTDFTHTSLAAVVSAITPILTAHGFSLSWIPRTDGLSVTVTCRLTHAGGHHEDAAITEMAENNPKVPAKGILGTITRIKRHTVLSLLGLATRDMEDADSRLPAPADRVDTARNLKAAGALRKYGRTIQEAEAHLGRTCHAWTTADLDDLREWLTAAPGEDPEQPPDDEPPHNPETGEVIDEPAADPEAAYLAEFDDVAGKAASKSELDAVAKAATAKLSAPAKATAREIYKRHVARIAGASHV